MYKNKKNELDLNIHSNNKEYGLKVSPCRISVSNEREVINLAKDIAKDDLFMASLTIEERLEIIKDANADLD